MEILRDHRASTSVGWHQNDQIDPQDYKVLRLKRLGECGIVVPPLTQAIGPLPNMG